MKRNRMERNEMSLCNVAVPYRALFSETEQYCIEQYWKHFRMRTVGRFIYRALMCIQCVVRYFYTVFALFVKYGIVE